MAQIAVIIAAVLLTFLFVTGVIGYFSAAQRRARADDPKRGPFWRFMLLVFAISAGVLWFIAAA